MVRSAQRVKPFVLSTRHAQRLGLRHRGGRVERPLARVHPVAAGKLELLQRTRGSRVHRMGLPVHRHAALMQVQQERGQTHGVYHFSWSRGDVLFCSRRLDVRVVCVQSSLKSYFPVGTNVFASSTNHRSDSWNIHISVVFWDVFFFFHEGSVSTLLAAK